MSPSRRVALIAGLWFAGTFVFSIPAGLLYAPLLNDASEGTPVAGTPTS